MKVQLLTSRSGPKISQQAGDIIEVSEKEGKRLLETEQAVPVREKRETATQKVRETR